MEILEKVIQEIQKEDTVHFLNTKEEEGGYTFRETIKLMLDSIGGETINKMNESDTVYKKTEEELQQLETRYETLSLNQGDRDIVDSMRDKFESIKWDLRTNAYLAGYIDCYLLLKYLGVTNE